MQTFKKVWRYIRRYKKLLFFTISSLLICQVLLLVSPFIVKEILDNYLVGVEEPWYEVISNSDEYTIEYNNKFYKQGKYFNESEIKGKQVSLFQYRGAFYFYEDEIKEGTKKVTDNVLMVKTKDGSSYTYDVLRLKNTDVSTFYKPSVKPLIILICLLFIRILLSTVFSYIQRISAMMINVNIVRDARVDALKSLEQMPITYYESEPAGKIANRVIGDVNGLMGLFSTIINLVFNASLSVIFSYIGMFILDWKLALFTLLAYPIIYIWIKYFIKVLKEIASKVNELNSLITASLNEIINGISILQIFNYKKQTADNFNKLNEDFMGLQLKEVKLHIGLGWNMIHFVRGLITAVIILYFGLADLNLPNVIVTAGIIYAYNEYLTRLVDPVSTLFQQASTFEHSIVRTERIFKIIDGDKEDFTKAEIKRSEGKIDFNNVWFQYNPGNFVLKGIDLHIKPHEMVGVVGHTGSGKSTLMSLLLRFYDIKEEDMGEIFVDDVDITTYSKRTYRQNVGIILQDPVLFKGTIADNIRFGLDDVTDEEVERVLREIGGGPIIDKLEKGINQDVSRSGNNFSVGEKQIISFARAIIHDKAILVMDEATANIDTETETMIQKCLEVVKKNRTLIIIAHRLSTIKNADKIVVLASGEKVEEGTHIELLEKNGTYANIYRSQVKISV